MNDFAEKPQTKSSLWIWIVVTISLATAGATAREIFWLHSRVTTIRADRFTAQEGGVHSERIGVLEAKLSNGLEENIKMMMEDIRRMEKLLVRLSVHMNLASVEP